MRLGAHKAAFLHQLCGALWVHRLQVFGDCQDPATSQAVSSRTAVWGVEEQRMQIIAACACECPPSGAGGRLPVRSLRQLAQQQQTACMVGHMVLQAMLPGSLPVRNVAWDLPTSHTRL